MTHMGMCLMFEGSCLGYFHRYLDQSFEKIIISMDKQILSQGILITLMEGFIFTHYIALEFHNGQALLDPVLN